MRLRSNTTPFWQSVIIAGTEGGIDCGVGDDQLVHLLNYLVIHHPWVVLYLRHSRALFRIDLKHFLDQGQPVRAHFRPSPFL